MLLRPYLLFSFFVQKTQLQQTIPKSKKSVKILYHAWMPCFSLITAKFFTLKSGVRVCDFCFWFKSSSSVHICCQNFL